MSNNRNRTECVSNSIVHRSIKLLNSKYSISKCQVNKYLFQKGYGAQMALCEFYKLHKSNTHL